MSPSLCLCSGAAAGNMGVKEKEGEMPTRAMASRVLAEHRGSRRASQAPGPPDPGCHTAKPPRQGMTLHPNPSALLLVFFKLLI